MAMSLETQQSQISAEKLKIIQYAHGNRAAMCESDSKSESNARLRLVFLIKCNYYKSVHYIEVLWYW